MKDEWNKILSIQKLFLQFRKWVSTMQKNTIIFFDWRQNTHIRVCMWWHAGFIHVKLNIEYQLKIRQRNTKKYVLTDYSCNFWKCQKGDLAINTKTTIYKCCITFKVKGKVVHILLIQLALHLICFAMVAYEISVKPFPLFHQNTLQSFETF